MKPSIASYRNPEARRTIRHRKDPPPTAPPRPGGAGILLLSCLGLCACLFCACITIKVPLWEEPEPLKEKVVSGYGGPKILVMDLSGMMWEKPPRSWLGLGGRVSLPARVKEELEKAGRDEAVRAVVLRLNSPGGTVTAADLIHHELTRFKTEKRRKIVACVMGLAASGGYYVAQAADVIMAQPTSVVGSIGVLALKFNVKELLDKLGVETELVKTGRLKDLWSPFRGATPEEARIMQAIIDDFQQRFVEVVAQGRSLSRAEVEKYADGRIFSASQALAHGLIDRLGYLDDAVELAKELAGIQEARVVLYHHPGAYRGNIYAQAGGDLPGAWMPPREGGIVLQGNEAPEFFYLWQP